jgi:hypothetical protein
MDLEKIVRERKIQARSMRCVLAEKIVEGISKRELRHELDCIMDFEQEIELLEDLLADEVGRVVNKPGFL